MTIIYITENNCENYALTYQNNNQFRVQKLEDVSKDKNITYEVNPIESRIGKSQLCKITEFSGAKDGEVFDGNIVLLRLGREKNKNRYVYIGGDMVCSFLTNDRIYKYISNMGNNLSPCSIAIGWEDIYYRTPYFRYIKKKNIDVDDTDKLFDIVYDDIMNREEKKINNNHSIFD